MKDLILLLFAIQVDFNCAFDFFFAMKVIQEDVGLFPSTGDFLGSLFKYLFLTLLNMIRTVACHICVQTFITISLMVK